MLLPAPVLAAASAPVFNLATPQLAGDILPGIRPSLTFARFSSGEEVQRYGLKVPRGATLRLQVLEPRGRPPVLTVIFSDTGQEDTLPTDTPPTPVWFGPLPLGRVSSDTITATGGGTYVILVQKSGPSGWLPYALGVNWTGPATGTWNWQSVWRAPWRFMAGIIWWVS